MAIIQVNNSTYVSRRILLKQTLLTTTITFSLRRRCQSAPQ